jgi:hypothetical protein
MEVVMVTPLSPVWIVGAVLVLFVGWLLFERAMRRERRSELLYCPVHRTSYGAETVWLSSLGHATSRSDITACDHFDDRHVTCEKRCLDGPSIFSLRQQRAGARCVLDND